MAFEKLADLDADVTISLGGINKKTGKANPTKIEGYFLGLREVADAKKKSGKSFIYYIQTSKGNVGVWGKTNLDNKMKQVEPGLMIRIVQEGKRQTPNGDMYLYQVSVDRSDSIEVASAPAASEDAEEYGQGADDGKWTDSEEDDEEETSLGAEEVPMDEVAPPRAKAPQRPVAAPNAARKASVEALLNKSRTKSA